MLQVNVPGSSSPLGSSETLVSCGSGSNAGLFRISSNTEYAVSLFASGRPVGLVRLTARNLIVIVATSFVSAGFLGPPAPGAGAASGAGAAGAGVELRP